MSVQIHSLSAVFVHAGRLLKQWRRRPASVFYAVAMPIFMIAVVEIMFSGLVEQFTGNSIDPTAMSVMIAVSMAFTTALIGAGSIVQERQAGLPDRLATFPGPKFSGLIGRVLASSTIALISVAVAMVAGLILGAEYGSFLAFLLVAVMLLVISLAAGAVGVMLGYLVDTPQGAVSFVPLVMIPMFFNTAMMPRELYAPALRPLVDISPVTVVVELTRGIISAELSAGTLALFVAWFGGLLILSLVVLSRKIGPRQ